ncbi:M12 family metallopeptidase [Sorangium sp. So ce385]|uniref:M12 family metallopeptidase n=1 Tax=Sorangium sp. So ce385 TaxID=3133308 RepID=UPI003F5BD8EC
MMRRTCALPCSTLLVLGAALAGAGCGGDAGPDVPGPTAHACTIDSVDLACTQSISAELNTKSKGEKRSMLVDGRNGPEELHYEVVDGLAVHEGDIVLGTAEELESRPKGAGVMLRELRWPNRTIPYVIDSNLSSSMQLNVNSAISHWEANTDIDFVPRTTQADYVEFVLSNACRSPAGRKGGRQKIELSEMQNPSDIVGIAIAKSSDWVYTWYNDGFVSVGTSTDLDSRVASYEYELPSGYQATDIVAMSIASTDRVYTWYDDGKFTIGTSRNLAYYQGPTTYSLPPGYAIASIRGIGIAGTTDHIYVWYSNGNVSSGTSSDFDAHSAPHAYALPPGESSGMIVEIDIAANDRVYTWFTDARKSSGTSVDLDAATGLQGYKPPGGCGFGNIVHEIGHAVGLRHEQSRCDRDEFVTVNSGNILSGEEHNFTKYCGNDGRDLDEFDFGSIMLYGSFAFPADPNLPTMVKASDGSVFYAQRSALSAGDVQSVRELYGYSPPEGRTPASIVGMGIASTDRVYTWYADGKVAAGRSYDLDYFNAPYSYSLPPGRLPSDIVALSIAKSTDWVYAWYDDGTVSAGTSSDLDAHLGPYAYSLPPGKTIADIVEIAINPSDNVYVWYDDGTMSIGTTSDLDAVQAPTAYSLPPGKSASMIKGIDIANSTSRVYVWFSDYTLSVGTSSDLDYHQATW